MKLEDYHTQKVECDIYEVYPDDELNRETQRLSTLFRYNSEMQNRIMHNIRNISFVLNVRSQNE